jgi:hypothetical protein
MRRWRRLLGCEGGAASRFERASAGHFLAAARGKNDPPGRPADVSACLDGLAILPTSWIAADCPRVIANVPRSSI